MIAQEKLEKLYNAVINDIILTDEELFNIGFNPEDISILIKKNIIKESEGTYHLIDLNGLYHYRNKLLSNNEISLAEKCLEKCFSIISYNNEDNFSNFAKFIYQKDYPSALQVYEKLRTTKKTPKRRRNNYYLYLLSVLIDLPEKYKILLNNFKVENFIIPYKNNDKSIALKNKVILYSLNGDFNTALNILREILSEEKTANSQDLIYEVLLEDIIEKEKSNKIKSDNKKVIDDRLSKIILSLLQKDTASTFKNIKEYLHYFGKKDYEFIILSLIKLSLQINDFSFSLVIKALRSISSKKWDINDYLNRFELCLRHYNLEDAKIYKDILINLQVLCNFNIDCESIERKYNEAEMIVQKNTLAEEELKEEEKTIRGYCQNVISSQGILTLPACSQFEFEKIKKIIKEYPNVRYMTFEEGEYKIISFKYMPEKNEEIDYHNLVTRGKKAYSSRKYDQCIACFKPIVQTGKKPRAFEYAMIGFSYLRMHQIELAIEYLKIADYLNKKNADSKYDLTKILSSLNGKIHMNTEEFEEETEYFEMDVNDFENNNQNNSIENLEDITKYISESGLDVETACEQLGLNSEQINTILLIYAKEFYLKGNAKKGDEFIKCIEQITNKSATTKELMQDIKNNKSLYLKKGGSTLTLSLKLKPKK